MDQRFGVMQFVARLRARRTGGRFNVFRTGRRGWYLFDPVDDAGCSLCRAFPVEARRLQPAIRRALRHGWGNTI